ncbi:chromosome segregation protein ScpA [Pedobacter psychrophilus]|uniref:Segregation and condensation protein A n=1 Tax=Pedobacter psychrophilus TaxID=1826909 RepID=A0A179DHH1_9SPHI|nr:segregation/condensation protein A [Pedobacter psychrophilus]OAQ40471.1 chromosome segregation protein ScpA [Pedobacter psychrophilus]
MEQSEEFSIKLPIFEGPFDLLLFFIEKDELDIYNIPIAKITNDFLAYLHKLTALNIELASEFIYVASTLMRIKAKMLLPRPELNEDGEEIDLKGDLIQRLIEYKRYKDVVTQFKTLEDTRFAKSKRGNISEDLKSLLDNSKSNLEDFSSLDLYKLLKAYLKVMKNHEIKSIDVKHTVIQYPYNIEEQKNQISSLITINKKLDFQDLLKISKDKVQFVYNFLAMLEMLQQQLLKIEVGIGFNNFWLQQKEQPVQ